MLDWQKLFTSIENDQDLKMMEPYAHYGSKPVSRKILHKFLRALGDWFKSSEENLQHFEDFATEVLRYCILIIDDIQDDSVLRRGKLTPHLIYGINSTLNAVQFGYLTTYEMALSKGNSKHLDVVISNLTKAYEGQGMDIYWRENSICPTEEEYKRMVTKKTGFMFLIMFELLKDDTNSHTPNISDFIYNVPIYCQTKDDYINLTSEKYAEEKSFCEDITEGKFSFPLIHAIRARPDDDRIVNILKQKTRDVETKKFVLSLLKEFGSLDYTKSVIEEMERKLRQMLGNMPENLMMMKLVDFDW